MVGGLRAMNKNKGLRVFENVLMYCAAAEDRIYMFEVCSEIRTNGIQFRNQ